MAVKEGDPSNQDANHKKLNRILQDMDHLNRDLDRLQEQVKSIHNRVNLPLDKLGLDDVVQQFVGAVGFVFPLVFTEEIWDLAFSISVFRAAFLIVLTLFLGYVFIGRSKLGHMAQQNIIGIPLRLITVAFIAYGSTIVIIYLYGLQAYYHLDAVTYFKAMALFGTFSVIGAIAVDMLG
ncbi:MAG: DUF2391 family protein [Calditrichaeota bacterium]|nr:MAG: DUF2391 family protein [Calditrichota bacterium]